VTHDPGREPTAWERRSLPWAARLAKVPKPVLLIVIAAILVAALVVEGVIGGLLLVALGAFFGWLLSLAWRALDTPGRVLRAVVVLVILALATDMIRGA
jgi:hypothetical protein